MNKSFEEFVKELKNKEFEPLPEEVMGSDDYEENLRKNLRQDFDKDNELVQYYIVNKELIQQYGMSSGKIAGQVAHVCRRISDRVSFIRYNCSGDDECVKKYDKWINQYSEKKIILEAKEKVLIKLKEQGFEYVEDNGLTEIPPGSLTCVGLGVMTRGEAKPYIKRLQLLK